MRTDWGGDNARAARDRQLKWLAFGVGRSGFHGVVESAPMLIDWQKIETYLTAELAELQRASGGVQYLYQV